MQLYDFHARQYDPQLGKFWGVDPASQYPSGYTGMGDDPANLVDPTGMRTALPAGVTPQDLENGEVASGGGSNHTYSNEYYEEQQEAFIEEFNKGEEVEKGNSEVADSEGEGDGNGKPSNASSTTSTNSTSPITSIATAAVKAALVATANTAATNPKKPKLIGATSNINTEEQIFEGYTNLADRVTATVGHRTTTGQPGLLFNVALNTTYASPSNTPKISTSYSVLGLTQTFEENNYSISLGFNVPFTKTTIQGGWNFKNGFTTRTLMPTGKNASVYSNTTFRHGGYTGIGLLLMFTVPEALPAAIPAASQYIIR